MFSDRSRLHMKIYQHKAVKVVDRMMVILINSSPSHTLSLSQIDAWLAADEAFPPINGRRLSEAAHDVRSLVKMTDEYINTIILNSENPGLAKSRDILERIERRDNYK